MALFRKIVEDYEARLAAPGEQSAHERASGKAEHERFEDGEVQFEVRGRGLSLADGAQLDIRLNGEVVARTALTSGRTSLRLSTRTGDTIPAVRAGDRIDLVHRDTVLLTGRFEPD